MGAKTDELRRLAARQGLHYTRGYVLADGRRTDEDVVTTLWLYPDEAQTSLTFEEDSTGALWCADDMEPAQAVAAVLAGGRA